MAQPLGVMAQRGRPPGQELVVQRRALRLHEVALLRAVALGMKPAAAARRYLPEMHVDARVVRTQLNRLAAEAQQHLSGLGQPQLAAALASATRAACSTAAGADTLSERPTLEAFARRFDLDMFPERELIELYEQEYGQSPRVEPDVLQTAVDAQTVDRAVAGLDLLQSRGVTAPHPGDSLSQWLSPRLCRQLRPFGVLCLADLLTFANGAGRTWWRKVPGLGRERAGRLMQWLEDHRAFLGCALSQRLGSSWSVQAPADRALSWPSLRSQGANALGADSDIEAVQTWLKTLTLKSPNTLAAYRRDTERLLLWAHERGRSLSTLQVGDAIDHAHFLLAPPAHWVNPLPSGRGQVDWRPMRGPLSVASANRALAAIGHLYGFLVESGYLVANPFAGVRSVPGVNSQRHRLDTTRAFGRAHIEAIQDTLAEMDETPAKRRLVALLALAESTGLRRAELAGHTWAELREAPGEGEPMHVLRVVGKGNRERDVPIRPAVVELLRRHRGDRIALAQSGVLPQLPEGELPLLSVLEVGPSGQLADAAGHLSQAGVHRTLKAFFRRVARRCVGETAEAFERASCHWLRHTFAHEVLKASGNDLTVTQQLLDHKNLSTTGLYLKADLGQRIEAVRALQDRFQ